MNSLISIIIPVYNASQFLPRCLDSILVQTFTDWQLLLVDDGSRDDSLLVMKEYALKDSRIKVYHKENEGVSIARQYGLDRVNTPYFIYCDADDYVEPDYLEKLYEAIKATDSDIAVCKYVEEYNGTAVVRELPQSCYHDFVRNLLKLKIWGVTWNKLYKTDIVRKNNISFIPKIQMWEDFAFTVNYCLNAKKVAFTNCNLYHYDQGNLHSITKHENLQKNHDRVIAVQYIENCMKQYDVQDVFDMDLLWLKFHIKDAYALFGYPCHERLNLWFKTFPEVNVFVDKVKEKQFLHRCLIHRCLFVLYIRWYFNKFKRLLRLILKNTL